MILKEWSEVQDIYNKVLTRRLRALGKPWVLSKEKSYRQLWCITIIFIILSVILFLHALWAACKNANTIWVTPGSLFLLLIFRWLMHKHDKAMEIEFASEYTDHAISHYPFWSRRTYFLYALFLQELEHRFSYEKVVDLNNIAEIVTLPEEVPLRPFENRLVIVLLAILTTLVAFTIKEWVGELVKERASNPSTWLLIISIDLAMLLFLVLLIVVLYYSVVNSSKNRHQQIQRFLKWAERDMRERMFKG